MGCIPHSAVEEHAGLVGSCLRRRAVQGDNLIVYVDNQEPPDLCPWQRQQRLETGIDFGVLKEGDARLETTESGSNWMRYTTYVLHREMHLTKGRTAGVVEGNYIAGPFHKNIGQVELAAPVPVEADTRVEKSARVKASLAVGVEAPVDSCLTILTQPALFLHS